MEPHASHLLQQRLQGADVVSFDIWDTVLRRRCHPDVCKLQALQLVLRQFTPDIQVRWRQAEKLLRLRLRIERRLARKARWRGQSAEYTFEQVWQQLWRTISRLTPAEHMQRAAASCELEFALECRLSFVDSDWLQLRTSVVTSTVIFLSDFYMGEAWLLRLLQHHGVQDQFVRGFVSCDWQAAKYDGRLYARVRQHMQLGDRHWVHVGDNRHSDVRMAAAQGVEGLLFQPEEGHALRQLQERRFQLRLNDVPAYWALLVDNGAIDDAQALGRHYSPLFAGFAAWLLQQARESGATRVHFFTREGEFFSRLYQTWLQASGECGPPAQLLAVSRLATFAPSVSQARLESFMRLWSQYSSQSPSAFLCSLGLRDAGLESWFDRYQLPIDTVVHWPWRDRRMQALFADTGFTAQLQALLDEKRQSLMRYFAACEVPGNDKDPVLVVDIGWRGSIQNNLALLWPERQWLGLYLGMMLPVCPDPANCEKRAWLVDLRCQDNARERQRLSFVAPLEMLCNSDSGSVTGYIQGQPQYQHIAAEDAVHAQFVRSFQQGVLEGVQSLAALAADEGLLLEDLAQRAAVLWDEIVLDGHPLLQQAFFQLEHNESFGLGRSLRFRDELNTALILRAFVSRAAFEQLREAAQKTPWKAALARNPATPLAVRAFLYLEPRLMQLRGAYRRWKCS